MKAFVKVNNGTFPNLNFYMAWEAFNTLGYAVTLFEEKDIPNLDVTPATPVFAGVKIFRQIIDKLGINYPPYDCYPEVLKSFYKREIWRSTLGVERSEFHKHGESVFVKPVLPKQFLGHVWNSIINLIPLANIPDDAQVYCSEPINIDSEFRVYVQDGEILGVKHYFGDWSKVPDKQFIKDAIKAYLHAPVAYGIDIGVSETRGSFVLETNDGCNLGNYGLDSIHYGEMIVSRWFEIMSEHLVDKEIDKQVEMFKGSSYEENYSKEAFDKPIYKDWDFSRKDLMLKSQMRIAREESMAAFAKEVQQRLKEGEV